MANWRNTKKQLYTGSQTYEKIYDRNLKQIQLKNAVYRCGELEENKWQTGGRPHTHSRTKCNFVSLVDDNIKLTSWAYQLCAPLSNFNEKCWQNQPQKFNWINSHVNWKTWLGLSNSGDSYASPIVKGCLWCIDAASACVPPGGPSPWCLWCAVCWICNISVKLFRN